ncbi:hypothetical protein VB152_20015, partial [Xanthomonas fragariae]|nr:hypothetical protein [Xanthomonas fragariae]
VRMTENCKKPAFSVANTGSFGTPVQTSRPCGRWVVGVFQGRLIRTTATKATFLTVVGPLPLNDMITTRMSTKRHGPRIER